MDAVILGVDGLVLFNILCIYFYTIVCKSTKNLVHNQINFQKLA